MKKKSFYVFLVHSVRLWPNVDTSRQSGNYTNNVFRLRYIDLFILKKKQKGL